MANHWGKSIPCKDGNRDAKVGTETRLGWLVEGVCTHTHREGRGDERDN